MPVTFLTNSERNQFEQIPLISEIDLKQGFFLFDSDKQFIGQFHGSINQVAISIQLCLIRHFGFLSDEWKQQIPIIYLTLLFLNLIWGNNWVKSMNMAIVQ